jgi:NAD+ diphosphatase
MRTSRHTGPPARFCAGLTAPDAPQRILCFAFSRERVLVIEPGHDLQIPTRGDLETHGIHMVAEHFLGVLDDAACFAVELPDAIAVPAGWRLLGVRALLGRLEAELLEIAGLAHHIQHWNRRYRVCPTCGAALEPKAGERAKRCAACEADFFPLVSPCTIVLVHDGPRIVMTRAPHFPPGMYGLVAGFVEPGETLEACAIREVREETNLDVTDVEYFGSQPWPFPHQIMVGFFARATGGELVVDRNELEDARWFHRDELPFLPPPVSIARALIDAWLERCSARP